MYGIMFFLTPCSVDDIWYLENSVGTKGSWEYFISTVANCWEHWQYDTGRLCNMAAAPFLALFPKWIYAAITSFAVWIIYIGGPILTKSRFISYASAFWIVTVTFIFPWFDFMFGIIFSINYVWTWALAIIFFYWFIKAESIRQYHVSTGISLFILSFMLGWWHEGFSVPLIISLSAYFIIRRIKPNKTRLLMIAGMICGISMILVMPAFWNSTESRHSVIFKPVLWETILGFAFMCLFYVYLLMFVIIISNSRLRKRLKTDKNRKLAVYISILIYGAVSSAIYVKYYTGPRVGCFVQIISALGIMDICRLFKIPRKLDKDLLRTITVSAALVISFINMSASIVMQKRLTKEFDDVRSLYDRYKDINGGIVYYDQTPRKLGIDFFKPSYKILNTPYGLEHGLSDIKIIPKALENLDPASPDMIKCKHDDSLYIYKNILILKGNKPDRPLMARIYTPGNGKIISRIFHYEFTDKNRDPWTYVKTMSQTLDPSIKITDAQLY